LPADTTVCGMSSRLVQVTVVPTLTLRSAGANTKLSICTSVSSARAPVAGRSTAAAMTRPKSRRLSAFICYSRSALDRRVDDRKALVALLEVDAGDAEHGAELRVLDLHRSGRSGRARRRLRERGGAGSVEGDIALDLLHHLVD